MIVARIKGLKISEADERVNITGKEMIPFQDGDKNGKIRLAELKDMSLYMFTPAGDGNTVSEAEYNDLMSAILAGKVIYIVNNDRTGVKLVTEVAVSDGNIHMESPDFTTEAGTDKISKVWFDVVDITANYKVTRGIRETVTIKTTGDGSQVLTDNGQYVDITALALTLVVFKAGDGTSVYDLTTEDITFDNVDTPCVSWVTTKTGNKIKMSLHLAKATLTLDGIMSKEDKQKLDVEIPAEIERLDKRCNKLRKSINKVKDDLAAEVEERKQEVSRLDSKIADEAKHRTDADKELKALWDAETLLREEADNRLNAKIDSETKKLDDKFTSKTDSLDSTLKLETADRVAHDNNLLSLITEFKGTVGKPGGLALLDSTGKVPSTLLPSYVDDVIEKPTKADFPEIGESGIIYVDIETNLTYRWSGSEYVEISPSIALGETPSTAFPGDRGKALEDKINTVPDRIVTRFAATTTTEELVKVNHRYKERVEATYGEELIEGTDIPAATTKSAGVMTALDKQLLNDLPNQLLAERERAEQAEGVLRGLIATETDRALAAEAELRERLQLEITDRIADVDAEESRAKKEEQRLELLIEDEATERESADNTLRDALTKETNERVEKDTLLEKEILSLKEKDTQHDSDISALLEKDKQHDSDIAGLKEKTEQHDTDIAGLKDKDTEHEQLLLELQDALEGVQSNPIELNITGSGNAVDNASLSGKTLTLNKTFMYFTNKGHVGDASYTDLNDMPYSGAWHANSTYWSNITNDGGLHEKYPNLFYEYGTFLQFSGSGDGKYDRALLFIPHYNANRCKGFFKREIYDLANGHNKEWFYIPSIEEVKQEITTAITESSSTVDDRYVKKTGDTMSGPLTVSMTNDSHIAILSKTAENNAFLRLCNTTSDNLADDNSWDIRVNNSTTLQFAPNAGDYRMKIAKTGTVSARSETAPNFLSVSPKTNYSYIRFASDDNETSPTDYWDIAYRNDNYNGAGEYLEFRWRGADGYEGKQDSDYTPRLSNKGELTIPGTITGKSTIVCEDKISAVNGFFKESDIRLKTDIKPLNHTLEQICAIPTDSFTLRGKQQIGTIAQELELIGITDVVTESKVAVSEVPDSSQFEVITENGIDYVKVKQVEYDMLSVLAIEGIKLLKDEIAKLKAEIAELKGK